METMLAMFIMWVVGVLIIVGLGSFLRLMEGYEIEKQTEMEDQTLEKGD